MFASAGRAVARRLPIATGQLLPQTLVLRPALATRAFTTSHEALQPKIKASATKEGTTTQKPAAKKAKKSTASEDGESPKKRATKAKAKAKAKPQKKQLTPEQKEAAKEKAKVEKDRAKVRELKKIALLGEEPKVVKANPWTLHIEEVKNAEGEKDFKTLVLNAKDSYKNLSTSELESLKERCAKEKTKEAAEQKRWIESHSVETIYNANKARRHLKLLGKKNIKTLEDERLPKGARTPFILFGQARREELVAQDSSIPPTEIIKRISDAWHQASEAERKPFQEAYEKEKGERGKALDEVRIKARELQQAAKEAEVAENKALKAEKAERAAERRLARAAERAATKST